jgi:hypothetical protein
MLYENQYKTGRETQYEAKRGKKQIYISALTLVIG